jgi:hypothetical protein
MGRSTFMIWTNTDRITTRTGAAADPPPVKTQPNSSRKYMVGNKRTWVQQLREVEL